MEFAKSKYCLLFVRTEISYSTGIFNFDTVTWHFDYIWTSAGMRFYSHWMHSHNIQVSVEATKLLSQICCSVTWCGGKLRKALPNQNKSYLWGMKIVCCFLFSSVKWIKWVRGLGCAIFSRALINIDALFLRFFTRLVCLWNNKENGEDTAPAITFYGNDVRRCVFTNYMIHL